MKKRKIFLLFILMILFPIFVYADDIYNIDMYINITKEGNANIKEIWNVKADSGSEWYKQLYNLGNEELSNFKVSMDNKPLTYKDYWNIDDSLNEKAGYYGINYVSEGLELCFGKSDMNRHTFTLEYTLSNFVFNTEDSQTIYQTLFPKVTLDNFKVTIDSYYDFPDILDVWGYGYQGYAYVKDGKIEMSNEGSLNNDYVVLLAKFPQGTFEITNSSDYKNFDDVLDQAEAGTYEYNYENYDSDTSFEDIIDIIFFLVPFTFFIAAAFIPLTNEYGYKDNKKIDKNNINMYRDIPCNKNIYYANALTMLNKFNYKESNIFGAILLKWIKENKISFRNEVKGIFNKETSVVDLTMNPTFEDTLEKELFDIMYSASGDGILETKELEKWCRKNYEKFFGLFKRITNREIDRLKSEGHIYKRVNKEDCKQKNVMDDKIYNDSIELYGLKMYLQKFSDMKHKEAIEVHLWDEYLMFAYIFGIADKVARQFKNLYPEIVEKMQANNFDYDTFLFINTISNRSVSAASSARSAAQSYSSGGGGFSSGGGGGGSFGGGGSMGGR